MLVRNFVKSAVVRLGSLGLASALIVGYVSAQTGKTAGEKTELAREGTKIESESAICRSHGERLVLELSSYDQPIVALENLATQRILEAVNIDPDDMHWSIHATMTEFKGRNFLLLERVHRISSSE